MVRLHRPLRGPPLTPRSPFDPFDPNDPSVRRKWTPITPSDRRPFRWGRTHKPRGFDRRGRPTPKSMVWPNPTLHTNRPYFQPANNCCPVGVGNTVQQGHTVGQDHSVIGLRLMPDPFHFMILFRSKTQDPPPPFSILAPMSRSNVPDSHPGSR